MRAGLVVGGLEVGETVERVEAGIVCVGRGEDVEGSRSGRILFGTLEWLALGGYR